jgi:hypothetical protein
MKREYMIRKEVLLQLYGSGPIPISIPLIHKIAHWAGFDFSELEITKQVHFLKGQGFCAETADPGTGEVRFSITSAGMLQHEKEN